MTTLSDLRTERLILRRWRATDHDPFAAMNADPRVMEFFATPLTREQSDRMIAHIAQQFADHGFGLWAVEIPGVTAFAGYVGLAIPTFTSHFTPCVEIGWRLAAEYWGNGYASEGARAALAFGFENASLDAIVSFTVPANLRSRRVMERIGMRHSPADDFDHPRLQEGHPLQRHVLYRLPRARFTFSTGGVAPPPPRD